MSVEEYELEVALEEAGEAGPGAPPDPEDELSTGPRRVIAAFVIITALALMVFIFPWGNQINGDVLAAQLTTFGLGVVFFFLAAASFAVTG